MRKFISISILYLIMVNVSAQNHVSTNNREYFSWDELNDKWKLESQSKEIITTFEFNKGSL